MDILFQILCNEQTLRDAWLQVKQKNAVGGIDGMSVADFEKEAEKQIRELSRQLKAKTWIPEPYLRVEIPKKDSEKRKLGLLAVRDKIVQQAIKNLIEPYFEKIFLNNSYGYRPGKGHARAIKRTMSEFRMKKNNWVLQLDIDNYFDTIDHDILFQKVQKLVQDEEIVRLIALCVRMGVVNKKFQWNEMSCGVPQGAVLSPLLANLYLHAFDQFITSKVESYVRYADDFLIFCEKREQAEKVLKQAAKFLTEQLLLKLNEPVMTDVKNGVEFLGITLKRNGITISRHKRDELEERINSIVLEEEGFSEKSLETLQGIKNYYGKLLAPKILQQLDRILCEKLKDLVKKQCLLFPNKKILGECLSLITFFAEENNQKKNSLLAEILSAYTSEKLEKRKGKPKKEKNKLLIERKKKEYQKKEGEGAELVVNTYGCFIGLTNRGISVKLKGKVVHKNPSRALEHITIATKGATVDEIYELTRVKHYFISQMKELVDEEEELLKFKGSLPSDELLTKAKKDGFSDKYLSLLLDVSEDDVRSRRTSLGVNEAWEGVHVSGTENNAYYYSTYNGGDKNPVSNNRKIMILGGGPNRIGQGIEFDYCCVHASLALKKLGFETIIVNCNPETVSTDYDTSDKLYFEPLTLEDVLSIYNKEKPLGVIAQFGGQTPLNLAASLEKNGVNRMCVMLNGDSCQTLLSELKAELAEAVNR